MAVQSVGRPPSVDLQQTIDALYPVLRLVSRQYLCSPADADDVVQRALLKFLKYRRTDLVAIRPYVIQCVRHAAIDFIRDRREVLQHQSLLERDLHFAQPSFDCPLELEEDRERLERAMATLPLEQREVLVMKIWCELTFPQIAEATGVPVNTASSRYRYALQSLRQQLGTEGRS